MKNRNQKCNDHDPENKTKQKTGNDSKDNNEKRFFSEWNKLWHKEGKTEQSPRESVRAAV